MSILQRYFFRNVLATTLGVSGILCLILVGGRFVKYLSEAVDGRILGSIIGSYLFYRLPEFLQMILPLGFFIACILTLGRMYVQNEMSVLAACGAGKWQQLRWLSSIIIGMTIVVGTLSLWIGPLAMHKADAVWQSQKNNSSFETLTPGRFHTSKNQNRVIYTESISDNPPQMHKLFMAEWLDKSWVVITSDQGIKKVDENFLQQFIELDDGYRYEVIPGENKSQITDFKKYIARLMDQETTLLLPKIKAISSVELVNHNTALEVAELQWRFSLPLLVPILGILALALSKVAPRQGQYSKIFPAIFLYLIYLASIITWKSRMEQGNANLNLGLWWIHLLFLLLAILLNIRSFSKWIPGLKNA